MARLKARALRPADAPAAASVLAAVHARAMAASPAGLRMGERFLAPAACRAAIEQLVASPRASAVVLEQGASIVGFLAGERQLFSPEDFASIYAEPRSVTVPLHGHAVHPEVDADEGYVEMYAALAEAWVGGGFFDHNVSVSLLDPRVRDAWFALGFGRKSVCAVRRTEADTALGDNGAADGGVVIDELRGRDDELLDTFHRRLMTFQTGAPMFWPYNGEADARVRSVRRDAMLSGQGFAYVAREARGDGRRGDPLGSLLFVPAVFLSPLLVSERMVYLWEGFVDESRRAAGVGTLLLDHALRELHARGIEWCALHFVSGNPRGGRFWPSRGFVPVEATLHRRVDERVSWAKGFAS